MITENEESKNKSTQRKYNQWVEDETIEDYSLRYTPKSFRKWSELLIANTAIGSISFLVLEAIGASIVLSYGFSTAFWAILIASIIIFLTAIPISYYAARYNLSLDLITRSTGFGYIGSTITSLIYASFSFIFFALEAAIMAEVLELYFGLPLVWGYLVCSIVIIPLVFYGITFINQLQLWTQPIWIVMMVVPIVAVIMKEGHTFEAVTFFSGDESKTHEFSFYYLGFAISISISLIAQIGEQVDYLRFMPPLQKNNRFKWWFSVFIAGPGWIILGFIRQMVGVFLAVLVFILSLSAYEAKSPVQMYYTAYQYVFDNTEFALIAVTIFVIISQIKINVTNAYAGSIAWSNFFSRLTYSHQGRVVWMVFNIGVAILLMELGIFHALEKILGLYSNIAIAWIAAIVADLVINKPLGLSPKIVEFKRAYLFNINPVGVGSMGIASVVSILAFMGVFGDWPQSYSAIIALILAFILSPLIAWITEGKYYIARKNDFQGSHETHKHCGTCRSDYEIEDMAYCPHHQVNICSLCCSLDAHCHDSCKEKTVQVYKQNLAAFLHRCTGGKFSPAIIFKIFEFIAILSLLFFIIGVISWLVFSIQTENLPKEVIAILARSFILLLSILGILMTVITWWILLLKESTNEVEKNLDKQNKKLEHEITIRSIAEQKANEATRTKSEFLANMSHEIRTPMNGIIGMSHLALLTSLDDKQKNYLQKIDDSAKSLLGIINDILDFSKIEAGKLTIEKIEFDLFKTIDGVIDLIEFKAHEKNLELVVNYDVKMGKNFYGDSLRISQILTNLMSNAVKFTGSGEVGIYIKKITSSTSSDFIQFEVKDTGIGLSPEQQEKLFKSFSQADGSTTRKYGGTGLGLTICKQLVELMEGKIWVESELGKGSSFIFEIELTQQKESLKDITFFNDKHILVVDDSESWQQILNTLLQSFGFSVDFVSGGRQALEKLHKLSNKYYDIILMDWNMPHLDGIETTRKINEFCQEENTATIIMISAFKQQSIITSAKEVGIDVFLQKPINPSILNNVLTDILLGDKTNSFSEQTASASRLKNDIDVLQGSKILLAEDNLINQEIIIGLLENSGIKIDIANNGQEAISYFEGNQYDLILMDLQMPVMDGYQATKLIRNKNKDIPVIALTANAMREDVEKTQAIGMNEHLNKPVDVEKLYKTLLKYISKKNRVSEQLVNKEKEVIKSKNKDSFINLDMKTGLFYFANNKKLYFKILINFAQEYKNLNLDNLSDDEFKRATHTIKGLSASIGATALSAITIELDRTQDKTLLPQFYQALNDVVSDIEEKIPN